MFRDIVAHMRCRCGRGWCTTINSRVETDDEIRRQERFQGATGVEYLPPSSSVLPVVDGGYSRRSRSAAAAAPAPPRRRGVLRPGDPADDDVVRDAPSVPMRIPGSHRVVIVVVVVVVVFVFLLPSPYPPL